MPFVLKICGGTWENASRDKRELSVFKELGFDVAVLAKGYSDSRGDVEYIDGVKVYRYSTRPLSIRIPVSLNRIISLFSWAIFAAKLKPDVISGHDLIPGLTIGWLSNLLRIKKAKLIYDSHEYEIGRNSNRSKAILAFVKFWEKYLIKKSEFSIMVNNSISELVTANYHLKESPLVIRSTPNSREIDPLKTELIRNNYIKQLGLENQSSTEAKPFIILYHGAITSNRGIEQLLSVLSKSNSICGIILGNGLSDYVNELKSTAKALGVFERVIFMSAVPFEELFEYIAAADLSLMMIQANATSYFYSLPNKFFESIQALTPIVASDFPEMKSLIHDYGVGLVANQLDEDDIFNKVMQLKEDNELYRAIQQNMRIAKKELCWEKEKTKLIEAIVNKLL